MKNEKRLNFKKNEAVGKLEEFQKVLSQKSQKLQFEGQRKFNEKTTPVDRFQILGLFEKLQFEGRIWKNIVKVTIRGSRAFFRLSSTFFFVFRFR